MYQVVFSLVDIFARGGGGGSSGGGGGGGGGILALGYLPAYYCTLFGRRRFGIVGALGFGIPGTVITGVILGTLFSAAESGIGILEVLAAIAGFVSGYLDLHGTLFKKFKKNKAALETAAALDPLWDEAHIREVVTTTFMNYQADWSKCNMQGFANYSTEKYAYHASLMVVALQQLGRVNTVKNPQIHSIEFSEVVDAVHDTEDSFTAYITASADDILIDTRTNTVLFLDVTTFMEQWRFVKHQGKWLLDEIIPSTQEVYSEIQIIKNFAVQNGLRYSSDWGWLLLPKFGEIFSNGDFGRSDINNHCIGVYHNVLVQLYSYIPGKNNNRMVSTQYVVAQVAVPNKKYGRIIIRRKDVGGLFSRLFRKAPKGTEKFSTESTEFNKMYDLYASNYESTSTFELLHPVYIEKMQSLPFKVEIEVYDNTIFIYSNELNADYAQMFYLLESAFEELKI